MTSFPSPMKADTPPSVAEITEGQAEQFVSAAQTDGVGEDAQLTDEEREAAAYRAGVAMHAWYSRYQESGDRQALSIAHKHMTQMVAILAGRSPEYVAKLERERGLS